MVLSVFSFSREPGPKSGVCVTVPEECEDWERERERSKNRGKFVAKIDSRNSLDAGLKRKRCGLTSTMLKN